jgi:hypothetical protein
MGQSLREIEKKTCDDVCTSLDLRFVLSNQVSVQSVLDLGLLRTSDSKYNERVLIYVLML